MIMIPDFIRGLAVMVVAGLSLGGILEVWHVFVVAGIISLNSAFFDPAVQAVIPQIVAREELPGANARSQMVNGISTVIGPLLGGVAFSFLGATTVFWVNSISYLFSGICGWLMDIPGSNSQPINAKPETWREIKAGLAFLAGRRRILIILSIIGIAHFFVGSLMVALPFLAKTLAGNGARNLGYLETAMGLGLILGSIFITLRGKDGIRDRALFVFMIIMGLCYGLIGALKGFTITPIVPYLGFLFLIGAVIAGASIYWQSLLQAGIPSEMAGRIFSISAMIGNTSLPLAYGFFGFILGIGSITLVLVSSGVCLIGLSGGLMWGYPAYQSSDKSDSN